MRTIKFRAKDIETGNWRYGDLVTYCGATESQICDWNTDLGLYDIEADTIGQFIGMLDKNGKQIYEGDICRCDDKIFKVIWYEEWARFAVVDSNGILWYNIQNDQTCGWEIIGNIHDNPELIK